MEKLNDVATEFKSLPAASRPVSHAYVSAMQPDSGFLSLILCSSSSQCWRGTSGVRYFTGRYTVLLVLVFAGFYVLSFWWRMLESTSGNCLYTVKDFPECFICLKAMVASYHGSRWPGAPAFCKVGCKHCASAETCQWCHQEFLTSNQRSVQPRYMGSAQWNSTITAFCRCSSLGLEWSFGKITCAALAKHTDNFLSLKMILVEFCLTLNQSSCTSLCDDLLMSCIRVLAVLQGVLPGMLEKGTADVHWPLRLPLDPGMEVTGMRFEVSERLLACQWLIMMSLITLFICQGWNVHALYSACVLWQVCNDKEVYDCTC